MIFHCFVIVMRGSLCRPGVLFVSIVEIKYVGYGLV